MGHLFVLLDEPMAETRKRRLFSKQFKDDAVRQVVDGGKLVAEVGREIGVSEGLIGRWVHQSKALGDQRFVGTGNQTNLEEEIRRLRRDNARLVEERTLLKKAAAVSSGQCNRQVVQPPGGNDPCLNMPRVSRSCKNASNGGDGEVANPSATSVGPAAYPCCRFLVHQKRRGFSPPPRRRSARHLSTMDRENISRGLAQGQSMRAIAHELGRSASTITSEIKRNCGQGR
ncbi:MAG: hypothetical protein EOO77_07095 [Oxalobacteraceae bacterium]|nr:MAG: hypothetical protein EOO77_07095 [Oxalobacteraceae bacterium]